MNLSIKKMEKSGNSFIGSWTISCGHGLGTEAASRPLHEAIGSTQPYEEIVPLSKNSHLRFEDKMAEILDVAPRLRDRVKSLLQDGRSVMLLGGDHSIALGSVSGTLQYDPNAAVIWFDAHGDVNTEQTSPSGNIHGMPVAALLGWCSSALNSIPQNYLKPQNIFWVGVRDLDEGEQELAQKHNLTMFSTDDVHRLGMKEVMRRIGEKLKEQEVKTLHLSFDIDGMDPSIVKATGTKVPNGLTEKDFDMFVCCLQELLQPIEKKEKMKLRVIDFVEYNPTLDTDNSTLEWCKKTLQTLLSIID